MVARPAQGGYVAGFGSREAVIIDALRTPVGKLRGALALVRPDDLAAYALRSLLERVGHGVGEQLDEVILGCANQAGEDNRNVARMAVLLAGLPDRVPGVTVNRLCASGLEAAAQAARMIKTGEAELVAAGGVESMTRAPWVVAKPADGYAGGSLQTWDTSLGWRFPNPRMAERIPLESMGETAENVATHYKISRQAQDEFALRSHRRAVAAAESGALAAELLPVPLGELSAEKRKADGAVERDEGPRADTSLEKLAGLRAVFREGGSVTAGNSSSLNDGAAAMLVASADAVKRFGLQPAARFVASAAAGVDPRFMGLGPVPATRRALERAGVQAK